MALVRVDRIEPTDLSGEGAAEVLDNAAARIKQSLQMDLFDYYSRAVQAQNGVTLNPAGIAAVETRM